MRRKRGQHTEPFSSSQIILGARKLGKTDLFMKQLKNNTQMVSAEHYENVAIAHLKCLGEIAKSKKITYEKLVEATGMSYTNIGRNLRGETIPRYENYLKLYAVIMGDQHPDPCDKPETAEVEHAVKLMDPQSDIYSFEECLRDEISTGTLPEDLRALFREIIEKAERSYNSQFEV